MNGIDRRSFFRIVTASGAAVAAGGCGQGAEQLLPYISPPENIVPGVPAYFASVCRECPAGCGVLAKNRDGRVIKLEGNPDHPVNAGALCIRGQAALGGLYHPDRFRGALVGGKGATWEEAEKVVVDRLGGLAKGRQGGKIALVTGLETGSLARLLDEWVKALGARPRIAYEPLAYEAIRAANRLTFGRDAIPDYVIGDASSLVSFGADFLETWLSPVGHAADFARMHAFAHGRAGTFVHVEPRLSLTAANADRWVRNTPGTEALLALAMLKVILDERLGAPGADARALGVAVEGVDVAAVAAASGVEAATIREVAHDLAASKGGLAIGGGAAVSGDNATQTQVAINLLNVALGAIGTRVRFGNDSAFGKASPYADMVALVHAMAKGEIEVLLLGDVNPAHTLPAASGFAEALAKVPLVVSLAARPSETAAKAHVESWGDHAAEEGVLGLLQPAMGPVEIEDKPVEAKSTGDILLALGRQALGSEEGKGPLPWASFQDLLKEQWRGLAKAAGREKDFGAFWEESLRKGGNFKQVPAPPLALRPPAARLTAGPAKLEGRGSHTLLVYPSARFYDGRGADRAWLQEAPDSMTQITWDGWVEIPAETAKTLSVERGDLVSLTSPHGKIELPAYPSESLHPAAVAVALGQGRDLAGAYARQRGLSAGASPMRLLAAAPEAASGGLPYLSVKVELAKTGGRRALAIPQATHDQDDREIAQHVALPAAREMELRGKAPEQASHPSMYPAVKYPEHRWGMTVDLDACTGCQACVVACVAENNVPVVGREQVAYGRDQHWLRVERWEEGAARQPRNIFLPMFCQHCGVAPCEPVCPVYAAYHTQEGLNGQIYNRCVGTRYCGNNCPYHVRRFNWFYYTFPAPLDLQLNPEVTVRQLGVMEKCTMCVQRIIAGKDAARDENRPVRDGDIQTACQQTCPTRAIAFGDLKDARAQVSRLARSPRGYHVLEELGTRPAVTYLQKVVRAGGDAPAKDHKA
jgi:molybdopterin-containing oxidoreductase family iron-sulfur binding subunit